MKTLKEIEDVPPEFRSVLLGIFESSNQQHEEMRGNFLLCGKNIRYV